jgi:hypothetical protein
MGLKVVYHVFLAVVLQQLFPKSLVVKLFSGVTKKSSGKKDDELLLVLICRTKL